jgi:hypothetical protein
MKKLMMTLVATMCFSATVLAAGNQPTTEKWEGEINTYKLAQYLQLKSNQAEEVANICDYFAEQMKMANRSKDYMKALHRAIYGNLKLMKNVLTDEQYAKYTRVINITLQNNGVDIIKLEEAKK